MSEIADHTAVELGLHLTTITKSPCKWVALVRGGGAMCNLLMVLKVNCTMFFI